MCVTAVANKRLDRRGRMVKVTDFGFHIEIYV